MYDIPLYFVVMLNIFPPKGVNEVWDIINEVYVYLLFLDI
jgi:hypothetical protein